MLHIHRDNHIKFPPWASHERLGNLACDEKVLTDCCCCRVRADETVAIIRSALCPPTGDDWAPDGSWEGDWSDDDRLWWASYYDPDIRIECGPECGCNANPRKRWGRAAREMNRW